MFYEVFEEEEVMLRPLLPQNVKTGFTWKTIQEEGHDFPSAKLICIRTQSSVPFTWIDRIDGVLTRSRGFDHLSSFHHKAGRKVVCGHLDDYCSRAVAEHAVMAAMFLLRKIKRQIKSFDSFNRNNLTGRIFKGRKLLVVGVGCIGSEVVDVGRGLKMSVKGVDIDPKFKNVEYTSLKEGLAWAEILVCALPLTQKTIGLLNYDCFKHAQKGLIFVNISRGEISPIEDLNQLLLEGVLGGLSLDVFPQERTFAAFVRDGIGEETAQIKTLKKLKKREDVLFTPHNAFNAQEAVIHKAKQTAEAVTSFLKKKTFPRPILEE